MSHRLPGVAAPFVAVLLSIVPAAFAQTEAPERQLAREIFTTELFEATLGQASVVALGMVKSNLEGRLARELRQDEAGRLLDILSRVLKEVIPKSDFEAMYAGLLAKHYSPAELGELLVFYRTPLGAKMARLSPVLMQEGAAGGEALFKAHDRAFGERFAAEFAREFSALSRELERARPPR